MPRSKAFEQLYKRVKKTYLGKPVPLRYRAKYGRTYEQRELESLSYSIARSKGVSID